jgi:hypothetical protein
MLLKSNKQLSWLLRERERERGYVPVLDLRNAGAVINAFRPKEARPLSKVH